MSKMMTLMNAQMNNFIPINEIKERGSKKQTSIAISFFGILTLFLFAAVYNLFTAQTLVQMGQGQLIPAYMVSVSSFSIIFLTLFYSNSVLFDSRDLEMLLSLPIKKSDMMTSKFLFVYLINVFIGLVFMLPGGIIWIQNEGQHFFSIVLYFCSMFMVPFIPMCFASVLGIGIVVASSMFKHKKYMSILFAFLVLGAIGYFAAIAMNSGGKGSNVGIILAKQIMQLYPLSQLFVYPIESGVGISVFIFLSIVVFVAFIKIVSKNYSQLHLLSRKETNYVYSNISYRQKSVFLALYQKEIGRFFSSYMTVLNAGLGVVLLCAFSIFLLFNSVEQIKESSGIENITGYIATFAPLFIASMLSLSCPAASSISLEGRNIWILQTSPVKIKTILNAKIALTLTLHFIGYMLSVLIFLFKIEMDRIQIFNLVFVPACYSVFIAVVGMFLNKKYPNYDWDNEIIVVKQSLPVIVTALVGFISLMIPIFLNWVYHFQMIYVLPVISMGLLVMSLMIYQKMSQSNFI